MPTPAVTADRRGAWLLKVNPRVTDLGDDPGTALAALALSPALGVPSAAAAAPAPTAPAAPATN